MGYTNFPFGITSFGVPIIGSGGIPTMFGKYWFVDFANGSDGNTGEEIGEGGNGPFQTLSKAYAAAITDRNDVIVINGDDPVEEDTMITWAKNKIHVFGAGVFGATDQEPRIIFSTAGKAVEVAAVMKVTGWGNTFTNLRFNSWSTATAGVTALWDNGEGTVYTNCQFNMFENLGETTSFDVLAAGDSTTWRNCRFGADTLLKTVARVVVMAKGTSGSRMKNNVFENCYFVTQTTNNGAHFFRVFDGSSCAFQNWFINCKMASPIIATNSAVQLTDAVQSHAGLADGNCFFVDCATNAAGFCSSTNNQFVIMAAGLAPSTTVQVGVGITPT